MDPQPCPPCRHCVPIVPADQIDDVDREAIASIRRGTGRAIPHAEAMRDLGMDDYLTAKRAERDDLRRRRQIWIQVIGGAVVLIAAALIAWLGR
jgi:hypothetical protein